MFLINWEKPGGKWDNSGGCEDGGLDTEEEEEVEGLTAEGRRAPAAQWSEEQKRRSQVMDKCEGAAEDKVSSEAWVQKRKYHSSGVFLSYWNFPPVSFLNKD